MIYCPGRVPLLHFSSIIQSYLIRVYFVVWDEGRRGGGSCWISLLHTLTSSSEWYKCDCLIFLCQRWGRLDVRFRKINGQRPAGRSTHTLSVKAQYPSTLGNLSLRGNIWGLFRLNKSYLGMSVCVRNIALQGGICWNRIIWRLTKSSQILLEHISTLLMGILEALLTLLFFHFFYSDIYPSYIISLCKAAQKTAHQI